MSKKKGLGRGLSALFGDEKPKEIPEEYKAVGTIALGYAADGQRPSSSSLRKRATVDDLIF